MIKLTGEHERVVFLPERNPVQIKGVAGSGKTTVAIFRARHLAELKGGLFDDDAVAILLLQKVWSPTWIIYVEGRLRILCQL